MRPSAKPSGPELEEGREDLEGLDIPSVTKWFRDNLDEIVAPLRFQLITGGRSNLTFKVSDAEEHHYVLRRPPLGHGLATAHDVGREHRILAALGRSKVPVPNTRGLCSDEAITGVPFYVMDFIDGAVISTRCAANLHLDVEARRHAGESIADTLVDLHAVDPDDVGLGDLGRRDHYIARQLKRWSSQFQAANRQTGRSIPQMDEVHRRLSSRIPQQQRSTLVHGDFRLDNCIVDGGGRVVAVLDWELCTLGDPLADVGLLQVYWSDATHPEPALADAPTLAEGFPSQAQVIERYASRSDLDLGALPFYEAFACWRLAAILEGVYARSTSQPAGVDAADVVLLASRVAQLADRALSILDDSQ